MSFLIGHSVRRLVLDTVSASPVRVDTMRLLRGSARAVGRVVGPQGAPVANARIDFVGTGSQATTNDRGAFTVDSLPPGTRTIEARAIGFSPLASIVQLAESEATAVELHLTRAQQLDAVQIRATTVFSRNAIQFQNHKRRAFSGSFVEPSAERGTDKMTLRGLLMISAGRVDMRGGEPVIGVRTRAGGGYRNCYPDYYLDGRQTFLSFDELELQLQPGTIMGIEIYGNALGAPPEFGARPASMPPLDPDRPTCGIIAIWSGAPKR